MPLQSPKSFTLSMAVLLTIFVAFSSSGRVEAKQRKGKSASRAKSSKRSSVKSKRSSVKYVRGRSNKVANDREMAVIPETYPIAPDRIEVIENGSDSAPELSRHLNLPPPRHQRREDSLDAADVASTLITKRKGLKMDESRVIQIQEALKRRGFYIGETTGAYDEATIDAMRRFQIQEKISPTGYPTAHALKRLGL